MTNQFLLELGLSRTSIANLLILLGSTIFILGGLMGGLMVRRFGTFPILIIAALVHMCSLWLFSLTAWMQDTLFYLLTALVATHLVDGVVFAGFFSFLAILAHPPHRMSQYALFTSLRSLDKCLIFPAGLLADSVSWPTFFFVSSLLGLPSLWFLRQWQLTQQRDTPTVSLMVKN